MFPRLLAQVQNNPAPPANFRGLETSFASIVRQFLFLIGLAVIVMFIVGGFKFLTAGGDKEATAKARLTLTYAILGLIVGVSAWMILSLIGTFLGVDLGTFTVTIP